MMEIEQARDLHTELAKKYGTPLYIYSEASMVAQYNKLASALEGLNFRIHYAIKANSNLSVLWVFRKLGAGFDVVSGGEFRRAQVVGATGEDIVYAGVGKTDQEIEHAIESKVALLNIESEEELAVVEAIASRMKQQVNIAIRVNPDVKVDTHAHLETGVHTSKFGITFGQALELWKGIAQSKFLKLIGLHSHIGSNVADLAPLAEAYSETKRLADELKAQGAPIEVLDLGGGLGVGYSGHFTALDIPAYGAMVKKIFAGSTYRLIFEPGKYLVAESGLLLTKVLYKKSTGVKDFVIVDAGMNDLIRPSLYDAFHKIELVSESSSRKPKQVDIVGPVCESGCFFAKDRLLPEVSRGDLLLIKDAGAYGMSMASNYNSRLLPAEVLVTASGKAELVRSRQQYEDLWSDEVG